VAIDALNLVGDILTVAVFDADVVDRVFDGLVERNDEGSVVSMDDHRQQFGFDEPTIGRLLTQEPTAQAAPALCSSPGSIARRFSTHRRCSKQSFAHASASGPQRLRRDLPQSPVCPWLAATELITSFECLWPVHDLAHEPSPHGVRSVRVVSLDAPAAGDDSGASMAQAKPSGRSRLLKPARLGRKRPPPDQPPQDDHWHRRELAPGQPLILERPSRSC
jgi:hypothetical protein